MMETRALPSKVRERFDCPRYRGAFDEKDASERGLALNKVKVDSVRLACLFDPDTRVLYDARFFSYGAPILVAVVDAWIELAKGKAPEQLAKIGLADLAGLLSVPEDPEIAAPFDLIRRFSAALEANMPAAMLQAAAVRATQNLGAGAPGAAVRLEGQVGEFRRLSQGQQREKVEAVLDFHIRPGLSMDGGGIVLDDVRDGLEIVLTYQGTCGSCGISSGGTLGYIEQMLRTHIHDQVKVVPTNAASW